MPFAFVAAQSMSNKRLTVNSSRGPLQPSAKKHKTYKLYECLVLCLFMINKRSNYYTLRSKDPE